MADAHFPPEIANLPAFEGPFDAFQIGGDGCEVLFASYPAGTSIARTATTPTTSA